MFVTLDVDVKSTFLLKEVHPSNALSSVVA